MPDTFDKFLAAAKAVTTDERWGFGMRGGAGGHDFWATFVLGGGAKMQKGGLVSPPALAANRWFIDLYSGQKVGPPSAPTDGFLQTMNNMKAGRTAMTIHHIGSADDLTAALGDSITAMPVPRHPQGDLGDLWRRIQRRVRGEQGAGCGMAMGFVPVHRRLQRAVRQAVRAGPRDESGLANWDRAAEAVHRCLDGSRCLARVLPPLPQTADFTRTVWPQTTQKAMLGPDHAR